MKLIVIALLLTSAFAQASPYHSYAGSSAHEIDEMARESAIAYSIEYPFDVHKDKPESIKPKVIAVGAKWAQDYGFTPVEAQYYLDNFVEMVMDAYPDRLATEINQK
jgi:hypothetical protein